MPARSNFRILQFLPIVAARRHAPPNRARIEPPVSPPRGYSRLRPASLGRTILGFASVPPLRTFLPSARTSPVRGTPPPAPPLPPITLPAAPAVRLSRLSFERVRASRVRYLQTETTGMPWNRGNPLDLWEIAAQLSPTAILPLLRGQKAGRRGGEGGRDGRLVRVINFRLVIARPWLAPG